MTDRGQTPYDDLFPPLPEGFDMPFWYASIQSFWLYYKLDLPAPDGVLGDSGEDQMEIAEFTFPDGSTGALVSLDFQRYTGHGPQYLEAVHEVEFNVYVYPRSRVPEVPALTVAQFLNGEDQVRSIGGFRIHVPCDNPNAIRAGKGLFGEPKYLAAFDYQAPTPNDPTVTTWSYTVSQPPPQPGGQAGPLLWTTTADLTSVTPANGNPSPLTEYGIVNDAAGNPRLIANSWSFYGPFETYDLTGTSGLVTLQTGDPQSDPTGTVTDLVNLIGTSYPVAAQVFASPPVSAENRGWFTIPASS